MAILSKEDFLNSIKQRIGDDTSDDAMKFLEDMTDTFDGLSKTKETDGEDWKAKYEELDKTWRDKYKARFFEGSNANSSNETNPNGGKDDDTNGEQDDGESVTFDDLFEESEG